jgi:uncharacterized membrane protein
MSRSCRRAWFMANFVVAALIASGINTAALADLRICNQTPGIIDVSIGYPDSSLGWASRGWFTLPAGSCGSVISGRLTSSAFYFYAKGENGRVWDGSDGSRAQGKAPFCIGPKKHTIPRRNHTQGNVLNCEAAGFESKLFIGFETGGAADFTVNLTPTSTQAQPLPAPTVPRGETDPASLCSYLAREAYAACVALIAGNPSSTPAPPPQAQPLPGPTAPSGRPAPSGSGCQRYPNLC